MTREFGTCFFEQYAQIVLTSVLGNEFADLVNLDRPDLQSPDGHRLGIEVTRAMEENRKAEDELLRGVSGDVPAPSSDEETEWILESGYAYGLKGGRYVGAQELPYWSMALPLKRIIESKVSKVSNGFYGHFEKAGLFVFSRDNLREVDAFRTMRYTLSVQANLETRFNRLYLADIDDLFVCNLDDGLQDSSRLGRYRISQEDRRAWFAEAVRRQNASD